MKKQTQSLTTTTIRPGIKKIELIFFVVIATIIYRNQSSRRMPSMPPNSIGIAKKALRELANFFYHVTGESMASLIQFLAVAALIILLAIGIVYIIRTH